MENNNKKNFIVYDSTINDQNKQNESINSSMEQNITSNQHKKFCNFNLDDEINDKNTFNIKVIGIGGAGCNIIKNIAEKHPIVKKSASLYAFNTDKNSLKLLFGANIENIYLLDKENLSGYGSGGDPIIGQNAIKHDSEAIKEELKDTDILFIIAGMGKGTGSGGAPELAKIAKELGILTVGIITMPSLVCEGNHVYNNAYNALTKLKEYCNSITTISNEKIINNEKGISFIHAYEKANDKIANIIEEIVDIIFNPSQINIDFADLKNFFTKNKFFMMVKTIFNETNTQKTELLEQIIKSISESYSDIDIVDAKNIIINLKISNETASNIIEDIRKSFISVTKSSSLSLVSGINSSDEKQLSLSALISGKIKTDFDNDLSFAFTDNDKQGDLKNFSNNASEFDDNASYSTNKLEKKTKDNQFDEEIE